MRIERIEDEQFMGKPVVAVWFNDKDEHSIKRWTREGSAAQAICGAAGKASAFAHWLRKSAREAERDIAYLRHGNKWRDHIPVTPGFFAAATSDKERQLLDEAQRMRPDLFANV